ncbi:MAG: PTS sugar transporter subunit IIA [Desulfurococcaceae archaeon]
MANIVLITHGKYGEGLVDALALLLGDEAIKGIHVITLGPLDSPESLYEKIKDVVNGVDHEKGVLILVDLFGGTPSRVAAQLLSEGFNVEVISGVNLPMLVEIVLQRDKTAKDLVEIAIRSGVEGIVDIGEKVRKALDKKD